MIRWKVFVDIVLFVTFVSVAVTGFWPGFFFQRNLFKLLHVDMSYLLTAAIVVHLALNWRWIARQIFRIKPKSPA